MNFFELTPEKRIIEEEKPAKKKEKPKQDRGISRRDFLKKAALGAGAALLMPKAAEIIGKKLAGEPPEHMMTKEEYEVSMDKIDRKSAERLRKIEEGNQKYLRDIDDEIDFLGAESTTETGEETEEDVETYKKEVENLFNYNAPRIHIDPETVRKIRVYWDNEYKEYPEAVEETVATLEPLDDRMSDIFRKSGVPEDLRYLPIIESPGRRARPSEVGARGYFQFMPETAREYGLRVNAKTDERDLPMKSAEAAASYLRDLYKATGDWNLALSAYNGSFARRYAEMEKKKGKLPTYKGFLSFLETKVNQLRDAIKANKEYRYAVKPKDTLINIARRYGTTIHVLMHINKITPATLKAGQVIRVPLPEPQKKAMFEARAKGILQNLNYVPKFEAALKVAKQAKRGYGPMIAENGA